MSVQSFSNKDWHLGRAENLAKQIQDYGEALKTFQWLMDRGDLPQDYDYHNNALIMACPSRNQRDRLVQVLELISN